MEYFFSLGSNIGNRSKNLETALDFLKEHIKILSLSSVYKTTPINMKPETEYFFNMVIKAESSVTPLKMLRLIKIIEQKMGRKKKERDKGFSFEDRIIDIDIIFAGDKIINLQELTIPHKEMLNRAFVLVPLNEIAPNLSHPVLNKPISYFLEQLKDKDKIIKIIQHNIIFGS